MSKEQIKEMAVIINKAKHDMWEGNCKFENHSEMIAEYLYNAGCRKQSEWISVDERLPKQWEMVLVCCEGDVSEDFISSSGRWYEHYVHEMVTHWMPLPEAPKMKGGAEDDK